MKVHIFDDNKESRDLFVELFQDPNLLVEPVDNPGSNIQEIINSLAGDSFLFSDYRLKPHQYANFDGDEIISIAYNNHIPGMLCSSLSDFDSILGRSIRREIPMIAEIKDVTDPELIYLCNDICIKEFKGEFSESRKPWRTLCRVAEYDSKYDKVYLVIPGWDSKTKISAPLSDFPKEIEKKVREEGFRFYCKVNMGCENPRELYFTDVEIDT